MDLTELDCLTLFETEPDREFGNNWFDSSNLYRLSYPNGLGLSCAIHPIHKDIRVKIFFEKITIIDIEFMTVINIKYNDIPIESLAIATKNSTNWLLTVKPFPKFVKL